MIKEEQDRKEWERKEKKRKKIAEENKNEVDLYIKNELPKLPSRCIEAAKKGEEIIRIMRLENRHFVSGVSLKDFTSIIKTYNLSTKYKDYVDDPSIIGLIKILEKKGFDVWVSSNASEREDFFFTLRVYLVISWHTNCAAGNIYLS